MKRGQGLLETTVALGVIMTGLVSVISLTIGNLTNQRSAALRYQAVNLAREGIELVRNQRDSNWLAGESASEGITAGTELAMQVNPATGAVLLILPLEGGDAPNIAVTHCGDEPFTQATACTDATAFSRRITITPRNCRDEGMIGDILCDQIEALDRLRDPIAFEVQSRVSWIEPNGGKSITINETLYDWR